MYMVPLAAERKQMGNPIMLQGLDATRDIREGISISNRRADLDPSTFQTHNYVDDDAHGSRRTLQIIPAAL